MPSPPSAARRAFLRLAALAPLWPLLPLSPGCAGARVGGGAGPAAGPSAAPGAGALELVRAFPLPDDAEPAAVFRAAAPRRGGR
ncbi:MAG: hypothetical protein IPO09_12730 [Anaeromyxobacter sp.]|nr:hypothetical protein [Anaeromyxobacter sp.]MBL0275052.1 hypothetical protein [Anaeromyxobacter sp.]